LAAGLRYADVAPDTAASDELLRRGWAPDPAPWVLLYRDLGPADTAPADPLVRPLDGPDDVAAVLRRQLQVLQPEIDVVDPIEHGPKLGQIRGLRLVVPEVRAKFKYGGNVDEAHRLAVADDLAARGGPGDAAARDHLLRRLDPGAG